MTEFGLIGTVTSDRIVYDDGRSFHMLGGALYQAAVWCGFDDGVRLFAGCGESLRAEVEALTSDWAGLRRDGLHFIPGPGNVVELRYGETLKEREEVLRSAVPPLDPGPIVAGLPGLQALLLVFNSGFDLSLDAWHQVLRAARCPVWIDIHSLSLAKLVNTHRDYVALPEWRAWVRGAAFLQANRQEVACMIGRPERWAERAEIEVLAAEAFGLGVRAVYVTMGKDGVLVLTPGGTRMIEAPQAAAAVDTTGCGDVFAAAALKALVLGADPFEAASAGAALAARAVSAQGLAETFALARRRGSGLKH